MTASCPTGGPRSGSPESRQARLERYNFEPCPTGSHRSGSSPMEVKAVAKFVRVQPRKVRQIAREVRGKAAVRTADVLRFHPGKGARVLAKVIKSAVANAQENHGADPDTLRIREIQINEGPM